MSGQDAIQAPGAAPAAAAEADVTKGQQEKEFRRFFASQQIRLDVLGTSLGSLIYLSLSRQLWGLGRPDLLAAAVACAALSTWPLWLSRASKQVYVNYRDYLFMASFFFHHVVGAQLARFVRLQSKIDHMQSGILFIAGHFVSSTILWQGIDAVVYRIRLRHFLWSQPLKLLASLALEWRLCQDACAAYPTESRAFEGLVEALRIVLSLPLALPQHLAANSGGSSPLQSCLKLQAFLLASLAYLIPAAVMYLLEEDSRRKFLQRRGLNPGGLRSLGGGSAAPAPGTARAIGGSGLVVYEPDEEELQRSQRRHVTGLLCFAVPAVWHAVDTALG